MKEKQGNKRRYIIKESKAYRKDIRRLAKSGFYLEKLDTVIDLLASGKILGGAYRDHALKGKLVGIRECHIEPDWLLLYQLDEGQLVLLLVRTGTHAKMLHE